MICYPHTMPKTRVTITIPEELLAAADRRARELDRSRSWVIADTLQRGLSPRPLSESRPSMVREPTAPTAGYEAGLGPLRLAQLEADLRLTPTERVRAAERTARTGKPTTRRGPSKRVLVFDRYEDYLEWDRRERILR